MSLPDLPALAAGPGYRTTLDESARGEPRSERGWLWRVPAKYGFIGVHGADALLAHCSAARVIPRLLAIPGVTPRQVGDGEVNAVFPPELLDQVAGVLRARRRRRLGEEQRQRLAEAGSRNRFSRRRGAAQAAPCPC